MEIRKIPLTNKNFHRLEYTSKGNAYVVVSLGGLPVVDRREGAQPTWIRLSPINPLTVRKVLGLSVGANIMMVAPDDSNVFTFELTARSFVRKEDGQLKSHGFSRI